MGTWSLLAHAFVKWFGARALSGLISVGGAAASLAMMLGVAALMVFVTLAATYAPPRHASQIDPMRALRDE